MALPPGAFCSSDEERQEMADYAIYDMHKREAEKKAEETGKPVEYCTTCEWCARYLARKANKT